MLHFADQLVLLRLNYEWRKLVDLIKFEDKQLWRAVYEDLAEHLGEWLEDYQVAVSSEYMIFDNCIRQLGSSELLLMYYNLIDSYKQIYGLSCFYPLSIVRNDFKRTGLKTKANIHFQDINHLLNQHQLSDLGEDGTLMYHSFEFNTDNLNLIDGLIDHFPNHESIFDEVRKYAEAIHIFEIQLRVPDMDLGEESEDEEIVETEESEKNDINAEELLKIFKKLMSK
jgi:hypothetical protein